MSSKPRGRQLATLVGGGAVLVGLAIFYVQFFLARPMGSGPAGPAVDETQFSEIWTERKVKLVGIGDSITAGLGAKTSEHTYFSRLIANPADEYPDMQSLCLSSVIPHLSHENLARSGSTSAQHLEVVQSNLPEHAADVFGLVMLTSGGNDLIHSYGRMPPRECAMYGASLEQANPWIDSFQLRLEEMLDHIAKQFPGGCEIYLANIYDPTDGVGDAPSVYLPDWPDGLAIHARYNAVIAECARDRPNVFLVSLYESFLGHGSHCRQFWRATYDASDPYYWYYDNIEDPNDRGYDAIRRIFLNTILEHSQLVPGNTAANPQG